MTNGQIPVNPGFDMNSIGKLLGNVDISALSNMLQGVDLTQLAPMVTQLAPMVSKMLGSNPGLGALLSNMTGGLPVAGQAINPGVIPGAVPAPVGGVPAFAFPEPFLRDPRYVVLSTLKPFLPQDKCFLIDQILRFVSVFVTIGAFLPRRPIVPPAAPVPAPPQNNTIPKA
jgi:hypothetical protein